MVLFSLEEAIKRRRCDHAGSSAVVIDIANVYLGLRNSSHSSFACSVACRIANLLLLATGCASLQVWAGLVSSAWADQSVTEIQLLKKCTNKPVKRFQMKSNGCRDVQHTGLQSTQTRRNTGKQCAQTRGTRSAHLPKHPYISGCIIIVGYANQFKVTKN